MINMNALIIEFIAMFVLAGPQLKFNCITGWLVACRNHYGHNFG